MSDRVTIVAEPRTMVGKQVKALRREGMVPGVIYGQGGNIHVQMDKKELRRALRIVGTTQLADVNVGGGFHTVLVREIQQHVTRGDLMHIDFLEVDMKHTLTSEAQLVAVGVAGPTKNGLGTPVLVLRSVEIECLPDDLVSEIEVDFGAIDSPDHTIYVKDLRTPKGVKILTDPDETVTVFEYAPMSEEEEGEVYVPSADAVEVIGRAKSEDEDIED